MFSGLLIILVPLIVGYLIPLRHKAALQLINRLLELDRVSYSLFYGNKPGVFG
ncbi:Surface protein [Salmonella enterica subsp. enterica]|nr:Surface protein [Salmonella enterica subsp. enterica]